MHYIITVLLVPRYLYLAIMSTCFEEIVNTDSYVDRVLE